VFNFFHISHQVPHYRVKLSHGNDHLHQSP
jgi:hypothetical protein